MESEKVSKVEDEVCELIQARAEQARVASVCKECGHEEEKYGGATMERGDLSHDEWLEHIQHELMDAVIYVQRLRTREQTLEAKLREWMKREIHEEGRIDPMDGPDRSSYGIAMSIQALLDEVSE